jgi:hypothetical protein
MDLLNLIKNTQVPNKTFAYYNTKSGDVWKVGPDDNDKNTSKVEINELEEKQIKSKEKSLNDFCVQYNKKNKLYELMSKDSSEDLLNWNNFKEVLFKKHGDITIQQMVKSKLWKITIDSEFYNTVISKNIGNSRVFKCSITKKHDPRKLIRLLEFDIVQTIRDYNDEHVYKGIIVKDNKKDSVYCPGDHVFHNNKIYCLTNEYLDIDLDKVVIDSVFANRTYAPVGSLYINDNMIWLNLEKNAKNVINIPFISDQESNLEQLSIYTTVVYDCNRKAPDE